MVSLLMKGTAMKTLKQAAEEIGIGPEALRRKILGGGVPSTRHPKHGHMLDDEAVAQALAIFANVKTSTGRRQRAIAHVPYLHATETGQAMPHPQEEACKAQIKGLEMLVAAHQAQVDDLQTRLTAAEATIRACALMAPAAAMSR